MDPAQYHHGDAPEVGSFRHTLHTPVEGVLPLNPPIFGRALRGLLPDNEIHANFVADPPPGELRAYKIRMEPTPLQGTHTFPIDTV